MLAYWIPITLAFLRMLDGNELEGKQISEGFQYVKVEYNRLQSI